jgi:hypothetical protein
VCYAISCFHNINNSCDEKFLCFYLSCSGYQPANKAKPAVVTELQPPDLWINYERARPANPDKSDEPDEETAMMCHAPDSRDEMESSKF